MRNNIPVSALSEFVNEVKDAPVEGHVEYGVQLDWQTGTRSLAKALPMKVGEHKVSRDFTWTVDEPRQIMGSNHAPNPQEYLLSGLGACVMVAFTVGASMMEIQIESLKVSVKGTLNLEGFLAIDTSEPIGFDSIELDIEVAGDGTDEQFQQLKEKAMSHSPNAMTLSKGVPLTGILKRLA